MHIKNFYKSFLTLFAVITIMPTQAETSLANPAQGIYLGQASTGEAVYFKGANFQCGDLPRNHECWWRTPIVVYQIGPDAVTAITDCQTQVFKEVWLEGEIVARDMRPQSEALQLVMNNACR
jgi:hypothetical protein